MAKTKPKEEKKVTAPQAKPSEAEIKYQSLMNGLKKVCGDLGAMIIEADRQFKNTGQGAQASRAEALKEVMAMLAPLL